MSNALLKGTFANLSGIELGTGGEGGGSVSGTGVANQLTYWSDGTTVTGDAGLTYNPGTQMLSIANGFTFGDGSSQSTAAEQYHKFDLLGVVTAETTGRYFLTSHSMVKMTDGTFFVVGNPSGAGTTSSEVILAHDGFLSATASGTPTATRSGRYRYCLLTGGEVLVAGGTASPLTSETWNSGTGLFTARGACLHIDGGGIAALNDGNAVVFGGISSGTYLDTTQIYNHSTHAWASSGTMVHPRDAFGKVVKIAGGTKGRIFVAGGTTTGGNQTNTSELFDADAGTWTAKANMTAARGDAGVVLLNDGTVMVIGGLNTFGSATLASCEIYDVGLNSWTTVASLNVARSGTHAVVLDDGRVVVAGGIPASGDNRILPVEVYDPNNDAWTVLTTGFTSGTPPHNIYGADLELMDGFTGLDAVIAVGGTADNGVTFLRDIRFLRAESMAAALTSLTLKSVVDNQIGTTLVWPADFVSTLTTGKYWEILASPSGALLKISNDTTADPSYGSGVLVGGHTFQSAAEQNIFNAPTTFGAATINVTVASQTIPSNVGIVRLKSVGIGDVVLTGTPVIAPGLFEGQRLITIVDHASDGSFTFNIHDSGGIQPISSPTTIKHYGSDYQESMEWVWIDGFWKTVSQPAQNPITTPVDIAGSLADATAARSELVFDWNTEAFFPPLADNRWQLPDESDPSGYAWFLSGALSPSNIGAEDAASVARTSYRMRNSTWSRVRINAALGGAGTFEMRVYDRAPWSFGVEDISTAAYKAYPIAITDTKNHWVSPPIAPGYHLLSFRFTSDGTPEETFVWNKFEVENSGANHEWNGFFDDFYGCSGVGATNPAVWNLYGTAATCVPSASPSVVTLTPDASNYATLRTPQLWIGNSSLFLESLVTIPATALKFEFGVADPSSHPAASSSIWAKMYYDQSNNANWWVDYAGSSGGPFDTGVAVVTGSPTRIRLEAAQSGGPFRVFADGLEIYTDNVGSLTNMPPFFQITDFGGAVASVNIDYMSYGSLTRPTNG